MADETEGEYPSIREALSNDSKVANFYCGLKYVLWMTGYAVFTVVGGLVMVLVGILFTIATVLFILWDTVWDRVLVPVKNKLSRGTETVTVTVKEGHEKSKETPVVRRLWGECPVSMKQPPRWFDRLVDTVNDRI